MSTLASEVRAQFDVIERSLGLCVMELPCMREETVARVDAPSVSDAQRVRDGAAMREEEPVRTALSALTAAERRVLRHLATRRTSRGVSEALYISVRTVEKHRGNIVRKLGLHGSNALLSFAVAHLAMIEEADVTR